MLNAARTKMFGHYASAMICAGLALVLLCVANFAFSFSQNMYLTENDGVNIAMSKAFDLYFIIEACFGAALLIGGYSMIAFVYRYYVRKAEHQNLELEINKTLYVDSTDGDKTIGELVEQRGKNKQENS